MRGLDVRVLLFGFDLALLGFFHFTRHGRPRVVIGQVRGVKHSVELLIKVLRRGGSLVSGTSISAQGRGTGGEGGDHGCGLHLVEFINFLLTVTEELVHYLVLPFPVLEAQTGLDQLVGPLYKNALGLACGRNEGG